jgi:hypothetical protein
MFLVTLAINRIFAQTILSEFLNITQINVRLQRVKSPSFSLLYVVATVGVKRVDHHE